MRHDLAQDIAAPTICIRVPGPWETPDDVGGRLPRGFRIEKDQFFTPDGSRLEFESMRADEVFPSIFRTACRRPARRDELNRLDHYRMNATLAVTGGCPAAAQLVL